MMMRMFGCDPGTCGAATEGSAPARECLGRIPATPAAAADETNSLRFISIPKLLSCRVIMLFPAEFREEQKACSTPSRLLQEVPFGECWNDWLIIASVFSIWTIHMIDAKVAPPPKTLILTRRIENSQI